MGGGRVGLASPSARARRRVQPCPKPGCRLVLAHREHLFTGLSAWLRAAYRRWELGAPASLIPRDTWDTLPPTTRPDLLSAEEAKEKLRKIVEGFFFRRCPSDRKRRFLTLEKSRGKPGPSHFEAGDAGGDFRGCDVGGVKRCKPRLSPPAGHCLCPGDRLL